MMFADLIDLEDFASRLRELGIPVPAGADEAKVEGELETWIKEGSDEQRSALGGMLSELEKEFEGLMLPSVEEIVKNAQSKM
ncbi:hypothetical protein [Marinobacterium mangrovicola]|uniref:Uncharacterized protein n=1 Tax=Marinobacterium mangrovicola TaxID=1476959 RepID=A0A4R1G7V8_9GAMM|nr:hypothetical protein [Marinobacterium mangrovicola]TCK02630.1 hypothetical protein CLV83_4327 [Marinobacterium mangrovicola]